MKMRFTRVPFLLMTALPIVGAAQTGSDLVDYQQVRIQEFKKIQIVLDEIRTKDPKHELNLPVVLSNDRIRAMGLGSPDTLELLKEAVVFKPDRQYLTGFKAVDFSSADPVLKLSAVRPNANGEANFIPLAKAYKDQQLFMYKVRIKQTPLPQPANVTVPAAKESTVEEYLGPVTHDDLIKDLKFLETHNSPGTPLKLKADPIEGQEMPVTLYDNPVGDVVVVLPKEPAQPLLFPRVPNLALFHETPEQLETLYQHRADPNLRKPAALAVGFAVVEPDGQMVDLDYIRHREFLSIQKVRNAMQAGRTNPTDFPADLLQNPALANIGLVLPQDQQVLYEALTYKPEGSALPAGFHPIDYAHDKAASYSRYSFASTETAPLFETFKDAFAGKDLMIVKARISPVKPQAGEPDHRDVFIGPVTRTDLDLLVKKDPSYKLEELKAEDIPLSVYTNDQGAVAFVLGVRPKQPLLIQYPPKFPTFTQSPDVLKKAYGDPKATDRPAPFQEVTYAIPRSLLAAG